MKWGGIVIRWIKSLFGTYESGYEYWINRAEIKVNSEWRKTMIGKKKFDRKIQYYYRTGELQSKIILDKDFNLLDGYSSVRIAEIKHIDKVPVYFVDEKV